MSQVVDLSKPEPVKEKGRSKESAKEKGKRGKGKRKVKVVSDTPKPPKAARIPSVVHERLTIDSLSSNTNYTDTYLKDASASEPTRYPQTYPACIYRFRPCLIMTQFRFIPIPPLSDMKVVPLNPEPSVMTLLLHSVKYALLFGIFMLYLCIGIFLFLYRFFLLPACRVRFHSLYLVKLPTSGLTGGVLRTHVSGLEGLWQVLKLAYALCGTPAKYWLSYPPVTPVPLPLLLLESYTPILSYGVVLAIGVRLCSMAMWPYKTAKRLCACMTEILLVIGILYIVFFNYYGFAFSVCCYSRIYVVLFYFFIFY